MLRVTGEAAVVFVNCSNKCTVFLIKYVTSCHLGANTPDKRQPCDKGNDMGNNNNNNNNDNNTTNTYIAYY